MPIGLHNLIYNSSTGHVVGSWTVHRADNLTMKSRYVSFVDGVAEGVKGREMLRIVCAMGRNITHAVREDEPGVIGEPPDPDAAAKAAKAVAARAEAVALQTQREQEAAELQTAVDADAAAAAAASEDDDDGFGGPIVSEPDYVPPVPNTTSDDDDTTKVVRTPKPKKPKKKKTTKKK